MVSRFSIIKDSVILNDFDQYCDQIQNKLVDYSTNYYIDKINQVCGSNLNGDSTINGNCIRAIQPSLVLKDILTRIVHVIEFKKNVRSKIYENMVKNKEQTATYKGT